jgi:uncharacterized protein (DUF1330 family)
MAAYIIARVEVRETAWTEEYVPKTMALIQKHSGKLLVGSGCAMEPLEGEGKLPSAIIVLEFPSMEQAKAWYHDPEYAPLIKLRQTGAEADIVVVDGGEPSPL